jgi:cell filamentation protein
LDLILKKRLKKCVDWSRISKGDYMNAMVLSPTNCQVLKNTIESALTDKINDREMYMKGIDYSYYYEENE